MSQENVNRLIELADAFNREDIKGFMAVLDPEVEFIPQQAMLEGTYRGREGVFAWFRDMAATYDSNDGDLDLTDVRDLGDQVLAIGSVSFTGRGSGIQTNVPVAVVATFREGLLTHFKDYADKSAALKAAGLSE